MAFQLPNVGDVEGQAQSGLNLINQIQTGDTEGLLAAGMSAVGGVLGSSPGGAILMGAATGALSGFATFGPCGAVLGAVVGAVEGAASLFSPADSVAGIYGMSQATQTIAANVQALGAAGKNPLNNNPAGWAMADYLSMARPPVSSTNASGFSNTCGSAQVYVLTVAPSMITIPWISRGFFLGSSSGDLYGRKIEHQPPLCTPVWFEWFASSGIVDCYQDITFGSNPGTVSGLKQAWVSATHATGGLSQEEIVAKAISSGPFDPFFFAAGLYGITVPSGIFSTGYATYYWNPDLLNGIATVLAMRSAGASTQAIVSELLVQSAILKQNGSVAPNGSPMPGDLTLNQYGFHRLVDDQISLANRENAAAGILAADTLTTWDKVGGVLLGAGLGAVGGILAYSAYKRQSPVVTSKMFASKIVGLKRLV